MKQSAMYRPLLDCATSSLSSSSTLSVLSDVSSAINTRTAPLTQHSISITSTAPLIHSAQHHIHCTTHSLSTAQHHIHCTTHSLSTASASHPLHHSFTQHSISITSTAPLIHSAQHHIHCTTHSLSTASMQQLFQDNMGKPVPER